MKSRNLSECWGIAAHLFLWQQLRGDFSYTAGSTISVGRGGAPSSCGDGCASMLSKKSTLLSSSSMSNLARYKSSPMPQSYATCEVLPGVSPVCCIARA